MFITLVPNRIITFSKNRIIKSHKKVCQKVENQHVLNRCTEFLIKIIEMLRFLNRTVIEIIRQSLKLIGQF